MSWKELLTSFDGRIRRGQFWMGAIGLGIGLGLLYLIVFMVFGTPIPPDPAAPAIGYGYGYQMHYSFGFMGGTLLLALGVMNVWGGLALSIKRWHDRDKSGWWVLINFVPFIGALWALIETGFLRGTPGPNRFGNEPV